MTLIQLEKGEGVKQAHVAQAFAAMCSAWGLPRQLYLDNGAEYGWQEMLDGFAQLGRLTGTVIDTRLKPVVRARPYNAPAKPIEGIFAVLEQQVLSMLPGWVGGNRMRQKTHNVGKAPHAFPGDWEAFHHAFDQALAYYHARPQPRSAHLCGNSPNQMLSAAIAAGWMGALQVDPQTLQVAFASEERRQVQTGGYLSVNGKHYFADALIAYAGERLQVRFVKWDTRTLFVFDAQQRLLCTAEEAKTFAFFGEEGARTQSTRTKVLRRHLQGLRANTVRLDLEKVMQRYTDLVPPAPETPRGAQVSLSHHMTSMLQAAKARQAAHIQASCASLSSSTPFSSSSQSSLSSQSSSSSRLSPPSQWQTPPNARLSALNEGEQIEACDAPASLALVSPTILLSPHTSPPTLFTPTQPAPSPQSAAPFLSGLSQTAHLQSAPSRPLQGDGHDDAPLVRTHPPIPEPQDVADEQGGEQ